jgi:threonyl-tRNA synthetase
MRILQLHSDFIEYEPIAKEIKLAEDLDSKSKVRLDDLVVVFIAVENADDESIAKAAADEIEKYLGTIKSNKVLLYPYAHLSSNLAAPSQAVAVIKSLENLLASAGNIKVFRAPFGWTKAFDIKVKGHPLAENSRAFSRQEGKLTEAESKGGESSPAEKIISNEQVEKVSSALKAEERLQSFWYILQPGGQMIPVSEYLFRKQDQNLQILSNYEMAKKRAVDEQPAHVRLMKKLAIADYEPASDVGNMRYYPKGRLMKSLIEQYVTKRVMEYGGIEVETPIMYDSKHPSMESYFNRFPARQYNITADNKQLFLRFAACFGQFLMAKDFQISYRNLPLKLYELTRYSFRREKSGELVGLRRLRAFTMPDCHALCRDLDQAKQEFSKRFELSISVLDALGLTTEDVEMAIRFTEEFYNGNKDFVHGLVDRFGKPVLVEMWKERFFYFILKWEFNYVDALGKASALSTDQIDVENGKRYGIEFVDEDGSKKNPIILHNSPSGAVERVIYALLEKSAKVAKAGQVPSFPLWLAHTQVRVIPVSKQHMAFCEKIAAELDSNQIRTDIDDRDESIGKKIRESEIEWIRYTLVIGDKELNSEKIAVRDRNEGRQREMSLHELVHEIQAQTKGKPYLPLNLPRYLSIRPQIMV